MTALCFYKLISKLYIHANQIADTVDNEGDEIMEEEDDKNKWNKEKKEEMRGKAMNCLYSDQMFQGLIQFYSN